MTRPAVVKLDKPRQIMFTFDAALRLEEACGINIFNTSQLGDMGPAKIRDFIWAGQLHTEKPLTREKVAKYLPLDPEALQVYTSAIIQGISHAFKVKDTAKGESEDTNEDRGAAQGD